MSHYIPPTHEHDIDPVDGRMALVLGHKSFNDVTETVARPIEVPHRRWWIAFMISLSMLGVLGISLLWLLWEGVGIWGNNVPVGWGWPIVNFVFWVGIGHAGTLISAVLFLFRQKWRTSINRAAEAMTIFAVICALMFPGIHVGRIWAAYWMFPLPNQMLLWPNFRSPLLWDVFAVSTYFTVSLLFWYVGLIPDIATMRDRAKGTIARIAYGIFALGWRGSHRHWVNYEAAYLLLAAMATPLVLSVHSIVSFDFAVSQLPGWHTTIFPPYFVAGAIFSGFGMVLTLMIPLRSWFKLEQIITTKHLENMAKVILLTGTLVGYAYGMEFFIAWYSGNPYESFLFINRAFGDYSWAYWIMMSCNVISPQLIWFKKIRRSAAALFVLSIFVNIGMWFERFVIVASSLHHDFLPSSWDYYSPTLWDISTLIGSFGLFFTLFCLFLRFLPVIAISEVKGVMPQANPHFTPTKKKRKRHVTKSAVGVVESRDDSREPRDDEFDDPSVSQSVKVVVSGANELGARDDDDDDESGRPPDDEAEASDDEERSDG
ncbi:MAG: polysulfide reductase NrfD [Myxococcales bacterium]|nr:polysulfide reductase NrfD [Myxococcales bacterium]